MRPDANLTPVQHSASAKQPRSHRFRLTIGQKFLTYIIFLSLVPLLVVGLIASQNASAALEREASRATTQLIASQRQYLASQITQLEVLLANVASVDGLVKLLTEPVKQGDAYTNLSIKAQIGYILNSSSQLPGIIAISIYTTDGRFYHVGDTLDERFQTDIAEDLLRRTVESNARFVWMGIEPNLHPESQYSKVITVTKALNQIDSEGNQKTIGIIILSLNPDTIYDTLRDVDLGEAATLMLLDSANRVLYHPNRSLIGTQYTDFALDALTNAQDETKTVTLNGVSTLMSYARLPKAGWKLIGLIPLSALASRIAPINAAILIALICAAAIALVVGVVFLRSVIVPIIEITERLKRLPDAQLDNEYMPPRGESEIGQLVLWYNAYLDSLKEQKKAQALLLERDHEREQLIHELEDTLRFRDEFMATMSHELRTPLNAIQGYTGLILLEEDASSEIRRMAQRVLSNSHRLLSLIKDILDLSRLNAQRIEFVYRPVPLPELIRNWRNDLLPTVQAKGLAFEIDIAPNLPEIILSDESRLTQIAHNLIQNAIKFTDEGGIILSAKGGTESWSFSVTDTGIGIPDEWQERIFEEFRQIDGSYNRKYSGAGLGLAIVRRLCMHMNGSVTVQSILGHGSTFTVTLPLVLSKAASVQRDEPETQSETAQG